MASTVGRTKLKKGMNIQDTFWEEDREFVIIGFDADGNYVSKSRDCELDEDNEESIVPPIETPQGDTI